MQKHAKLEPQNNIWESLEEVIKQFLKLLNGFKLNLILDVYMKPAGRKI